MTNRKLRKALLEKLRITPQALSQKVQNLKRQYPMTTEDATYIIAQKENIILDRYLDNGTVDRVRNLMGHISPLSNHALPRTNGKRKPVTESEQRIIIIAKEFKLTDPMLSKKKVLEAKEMASIYPLLYILENSIREVIDKIMISQHGDDWWEAIAPRGLRDTVSSRMVEEKRNSWHQRRGDRPIDYLDLDQLSALMRKIEKEVVPNVIPSLAWFNQLVEEVYKSRCVVCHMNPLDRDNIQAVKLR